MWQSRHLDSLWLVRHVRPKEDCRIINYFVEVGWSIDAHQASSKRKYNRRFCPVIFVDGHDRTEAKKIVPVGNKSRCDG